MQTLKIFWSSWRLEMIISERYHTGPNGTDGVDGVDGDTWIRMSVDILAARRQSKNG